jgi:hypothetical protein
VTYSIKILFSFANSKDEVSERIEATKQENEELQKLLE